MAWKLHYHDLKYPRHILYFVLDVVIYNLKKSFIFELEQPFIKYTFFFFNMFNTYKKCVATYLKIGYFLNLFELIQRIKYAKNINIIINFKNIYVF